jgi:acetyl esterase/lipase
MASYAAVIGGLVLLFGGMVGLAGSWIAARPVGDPTRRYSPAWLPAMVVSGLAPLWLLLHGLVLGIGLLLRGWSNWAGRIGAGLLATSAILLVVVIVRNRRGARRLLLLVDGVVHPAPGFAGLIGRPISDPDEVVEHHAIEWRDGLTLDLIRPDDERRELPVLVYVHGGGWTGGDPQRQARDLYHALARAGWATAAIRYPHAPRATVEHQIETVRSAIRWMRSELEVHGVRAATVALAGGSAGGHLAAMAALTPRLESERVAACVGIYGVYDMANRNRLRAPWAMIPNTVMGERYRDAPDRYHAVSPIDQDVSDSPPFLLVHGTRDTLVPIGESIQFAEVLRAAGRPVDVVPVQGAEHAFDALSSATSRTAAAVIRDWLLRTAG